MKIMDVQEFKQDQYTLHRERRTSQFTKFLDKNVDFVTYYSINKALSTSSINNHEVDSYISIDSPIRYNKINNLPVYGFPVLNSENGFDEEGGGFNAQVEGTITMLQEVIEPCEGDVFILNMFSEDYFFRVTEVTQVALRSKPYYTVQFIAGKPEDLPQLNKQVVEEYNAIFDNIGTQDKVIVSKNDYNLLAQYREIYQDIVEYYINTYYNERTTMFIVQSEMPYFAADKKFVDKFLIKFMCDNRIITLDTVLKNTFMLDFNNIFKSSDYSAYKKTIYWAIESKRFDKFKPSKYINVTKLESPFSLLTAQTGEEVYVSKDLSIDIPSPSNGQYFMFDLIELSDKYKNHDIFSNGQNVYSKVLSMIVNYLNGNTILPGYFSNIAGEMEPMQEYFMLPILLYIMRSNMLGLTITTSK